MGVPRVVTATVVADVPLVTTAETVLATVTPITTADATEQVTLTGTAQITAGTAATAITPRIRRGTDATGAVVGEGNPQTVAAGNTVDLSMNERDVPGPVAGASYVLTAQQVAATGNGSSLHAVLTAILGG